MKTKKDIFIAVILVSILSFSAFSQNAGFRKNPYVLLNQNTVTIVWQLYYQQNCTFSYEKASGGTTTTISVNGSFDDQLYFYELSNLVEGELYTYTVEINDGIQDTGSFRFHPSQSAEEISFYGYGDTRGGCSGQPPFHDEVCEKILDEVDNDPVSQTLLIHSGDWNVHSSNPEQKWDEQYFFTGHSNAVELRSKVGVVGCVGNHETSPGEVNTSFSKYWSYDYPQNQNGRYFWYSFDYGPVHFCFVDQRLNTSSVEGDETQRNWVENDLHNSTKPWKILVFHPPVYSIYANPNTYNTEKTFYDDICDNPDFYGVNLVLNGHIHQYSNWLVNGVHHLTLGGGGADRDPDEAEPTDNDPANPNIIRYLKKWHFAKFDVNSDYIRVKVPYCTDDISNWETLDEFIIPRSFIIKDGENIVWEDHGVHYYADEIRVKNGGELTIRGDIEFQRDGRIIVEAGGKLTVDGALLTCLGEYNDVETHWQGIQVWGNKNEHQFEYTGHPLAQGKLVMQNEASIQNAWNAVSTWKHDDWNTVGGIVIASNSSFINNKRSVEFMPYQNYHPFSGEPMEYISHFTNCQFIVDDDFAIPSFNSHITMCNVNGVKISGCEFTNSITNAQHTGQGIYTIDAGYRITNYCDAIIQPCPDDNVIPTTFNNFYAGIIALNSGSPNTLYVNDAEFVNNGIGIQLNTVDNATIVFNDFYIGPNTRAENSCTDGFGVGIDLINCNGYAIEENKFYPAQGMTSDAIGVNVNYETEFVVHHPVMYNEIYNNIFDGVQIANNTQGDNFNQDMQFGLVHLCNDNSNNVYDFYITDFGIQQMQGSLSEASGNEFSLNANNPYSDYNNQSDWSIMYFYEENNTAETPVSYTEESFFPIDVENANQCLSHYGDITRQDKGFGLTTSQKQQFVDIYNSNQIDYVGTKVLYESSKDGGDTPGTKSDVEGAWPDEMWETRSDLLTKSPHLTREVLVETADRTDLFPDAVIFDIFSANPDAMKDKTLLEYLETKEYPLPQYMIDILAGAPGTISYKTILESDMAEYGGKKSRAANTIIRNILNDSLVNTDSLVNWIGNLGTMAADYQIIDVYLQQGDTSTAIAMVNALPTTYGFETDNAEYIRYKTLKQFQVQLLAEGRNIYLLTAAEKTMLEDMVANSNGRPGMQARNILQFIYGNEYNDCPNMPDPNTHKSGNSSIYELTSNMLEITASPNPAKSWVAFNYSFPETSINSSIEIHNVKGELVHVINLTNCQGQKIWDTRKVLPSVYLFTLKSSGIIKSGKLIITK